MTNTKVTVTIETDEQYTSVSMRTDPNRLSGPGTAVDILLAQCLRRVADTFGDPRLDALAVAVSNSIRSK
jgi:hypothetical protein